MAPKSLFSAIGQAAVIATVAAVTTIAVTMPAAPAAAKDGPAARHHSVAATRGTDFSARRRFHHRETAARAYAIASRSRGAYDGGWECTPVHCGPLYHPGWGYGAPIVVPGW